MEVSATVDADANLVLEMARQVAWRGGLPRNRGLLPARPMLDSWIDSLSSPRQVEREHVTLPIRWLRPSRDPRIRSASPRRRESHA